MKSSSMVGRSFCRGRPTTPDPGSCRAHIQVLKRSHGLYISTFIKRRGKAERHSGWGRRLHLDNCPGCGGRHLSLSLSLSLCDDPRENRWWSFFFGFSVSEPKIRA